jgi:FkbM family methyltransferase
VRKAEWKAHKKRKRMDRQRRREERAADNKSPLVDPARPIVTLDYPRHEVRLIVESSMERKWRAHSCAKEPWTVQWLEASLREGSVLYDIGANVGAFSLIAARLCGSEGTVVAFEPGYASFARLCDNIVLNECQTIVMPVPLALGSQTGLGTLRYKSLHAGQSRHHFKEAGWVRMSASDSDRYYQPVLAMSLDDAVRQFQLPLPNHIKLDVDGRELNVLQGAAATLRSPGLESVLIEIDDTLTSDAVSLMTDSGFHLAEKFKKVHDEDTQVWYGVFRRSV